MADTLTTLADMVKINDVSVRDMGATDIFNDAPLLRALGAVSASHGTQHKYLRESGAPVVGFRAANAGREWSSDADTLVTIDLKILDASFGIDRALAESFPGGADAVMARKARRSLRAAFSQGERQFLYGTGNSADGFLGLAQVLNDTADAGVVDATGTANRSSVWLIRSTGDESDVTLVAGNEGQISVAPYHPQDLLDGTGKHFPGFVQPITGWMGLAIGSNNCAVRIANVGSDAGKGLTDALLSDAYGKFKEGAPPTHIVMNIRSLMQLQKSRTTYSPTGSEAPIPADWNGIPIIVTSSIGNSESALTGTPVANAAATAL
jgi:hypothetical protein